MTFEEWWKENKPPREKMETYNFINLRYMCEEAWRTAVQEKDFGEEEAIKRTRQALEEKGYLDGTE